MTNEICSLCRGTGGPVTITCSNCNGTGYDPEEDKPFAQCHTCYGEGTEEVEVCPDCGGQGTIEEDHTKIQINSFHNVKFTSEQQ